MFSLTLLVVCWCSLIMLSAVSWTQQLPNMKPSMHIPEMIKLQLEISWQ